MRFECTNRKNAYKQNVMHMRLYCEWYALLTRFLIRVSRKRIPSRWWDALSWGPVRISRKRIPSSGWDALSWDPYRAPRRLSKNYQFAPKCILRREQTENHLLSSRSPSNLGKLTDLSEPNRSLCSGRNRLSTSLKENETTREIFFSVFF